MDVAAGGNVAVVFLQFGVVDDAAEFFFFFPLSQCIYDTVNAIAWNEVLGVAFLKNLAGVDEEYLALPGGRICPC